MKPSFKVIRLLYVFGIIIAILSFIISVILILLYFLNPTEVPYGPEPWQRNFVYNKQLMIAFIVLIVISILLFIALGATNKKYKEARSINDQQFAKKQIFLLKQELYNLNHEFKTCKKDSVTKSAFITKKSEIIELIKYYENDYINDLNNKRAKRNSVLLTTLAVAGSAASSAGSAMSSGYEKGQNLRGKSSSGSFSSKMYADGLPKMKETRKDGTPRKKGIGRGHRW